MPTSLPNGYNKPDAGESGNIFCPVIEANWERIAEHTHDGVDSELISSANLTKGSATIAAGSWVVDGIRWKQSVSLPVGRTFDTTSIRLVDASSLEICFPEVVKTGASTYDIYTNDNSVSYSVLYI